MGFIADSQLWYALQVRTRREKSVAGLLSYKGYETFAPTCHPAQSYRRKLKSELPALFPGYVFCRFEVTNRLPVLITPGVIGVVGRGRVPVPVDESEMEAIQRVDSTGLASEPFPYLEIGERVRI